MRGERQHGLALATLRPADGEDALAVVHEGTAVERQQPVPQRDEVDDRHELRDRAQAPLDDEFARAVAGDPIERDRDLHVALVPPAEDEICVVGVGGLVEPEQPQLPVEGHAVHEPDQDIGLVVQGRLQRAELPFDDRDLPRAGIDQPDAHGAVQVEVGRTEAGHTRRIGFAKVRSA